MHLSNDQPIRTFTTLIPLWLSRTARLIRRPVAIDAHSLRVRDRRRRRPAELAGDAGEREVGAIGSLV